MSGRFYKEIMSRLSPCQDQVGLDLARPRSHSALRLYDPIITILHPRLGIINKYFLKSIIEIAIKKDLFITSIILRIRFINQLKNISKSHLIYIKILFVFVILCVFNHKNNNNYFFFLIVLYFYSADNKVDI